MQIIITEAMLKERKEKKLKAKQRNAAEHPECQPGSPHSSNDENKKARSSGKDKFDS